MDLHQAASSDRALPPNRRLFILVAIFFLSGMSGLIYQGLWQRMLSLVFGVTVYATSTVLASFMTGLALGSLAASRFADRTRHPLRVFGVAEVGVGLTALSTPIALGAVATWYGWAQTYIGEGISAATLARIVCSFAVLIVPTSLMGATLPFIIKSSMTRRSSVGPRISLLYAANTAGAVAGALSAGFVLIPSIGIHASFILAGAINLSVGTTALLLSRQDAVPAPITTRSNAGVVQIGGVGTAERGRALIPLAFALSGFASLGLEVIWFRVLVLFVEATTYAFSLMLATVLAGIAAGSALATLWLQRFRAWIPVFAWLQIGIGISVVGSFGGLLAMSRVSMVPANSPALVLVTILPPALLMGAAFPIGVRIWAASGGDESRETGRYVGRLYAVNVAGAIVGALVAGFGTATRYRQPDKPAAVLAGLHFVRYAVVRFYGRVAPPQSRVGLCVGGRALRRRSGVAT